MPSEKNSWNRQNNGEFKFEFEDKTKGINFRYTFLLLWDNKFLIAGVIALCMILSGVYATTIPSIYESNGSILVKKSPTQHTQAGSDLNNLLTSSYGIGTVNSVEDELQMLQSRSLSLETADTLRKVRMMDNGKQYPVLFESYPDDSTLASREVVAKRLRKSLTIQNPDDGSNLISLSYQSQSPVEAADVINFIITSYIDLSTQQKRKSANSAVKFLENEKELIQKELYAAEQDLQQYMDSNDVVQVDAQTQSIITQTTNLEQQRQEARTNLVTVNSAIEQYQNRLNDIKPGLADQFANAIGPNMNRLQYQLAELKTEKRQLLTRNTGIDPENPPEELQKLNRQIKEYEEEIRSLTDSVLAKGDQYISFLSSEEGNLAQNVSDLQERLIELKVNKQEYEAQIKALDDEIEALNQDFGSLPENMTKLARLKRNVNVNEELFLSVSKQHSEMALWKETQYSQGQLVDEGYVPEKPIEPDTRLLLLIGLVTGMVLGSGIVLVKDALKNTIDGTLKLKSFDSPLLSVIPNFRKYEEDGFDTKSKKFPNGNLIPSQMVSLWNVNSPTTDSFRRLESNILHSNIENRLNSLLVTSTKKGEGKTTVTANLGVVMAEADKKVIIIDTDLRRPNLHNMFGLERTNGIVETLNGDITLPEATKSTIVENLDVITAGEKVENPSAVLKSQSFKNLIENLEYHYDIVLLDTSPYGIITDFASLITTVKGVVVICRFGETKTIRLEHTLQSLEQIGSNVLGMVLNGFDGEKSSDLYYGTGYYNEIFDDYAEYNKK